MTLQESVSGCMKHWEFMAETGAEYKWQYTPANNVAANCFFCEYKKNRGICANTCPGFGYWAKGTGGCMNSVVRYEDPQTSLYEHWLEASTPQERKLWAHRIVWMIWLIQEDIKLI